MTSTTLLQHSNRYLIGSMFSTKALNSTTNCLHKILKPCVVNLPACSAHTLKLKRDWKAPLPKLNGEPNLKKRHQIYRVVDIDGGPKELRVILNKDILEYGVRGEVLTLPKMISRALLKEGKAVYASPENLEQFAEEIVSDQSFTGRQMLLWLRSKQQLCCTFPEGSKWVLTPQTLSRNLLRCYNLVVPSSCIELPDYEISHTNYELKSEHTVKITVNRIDTVSLPVVIQFISADSKEKTKHS